MSLVLGPRKTYRCPSCRPEDPFPEVIVLHGVFVSSVKDWDGRVTLDCPHHGPFEVQYWDESAEPR